MKSFKIGKGLTLLAGVALALAPVAGAQGSVDAPPHCSVTALKPVMSTNQLTGQGLASCRPFETGWIEMVVCIQDGLTGVDHKCKTTRTGDPGSATVSLSICNGTSYSSPTFRTAVWITTEHGGHGSATSTPTVVACAN